MSDCLSIKIKDSRSWLSSLESSNILPSFSLRNITSITFFKSDIRLYQIKWLDFVHSMKVDRSQPSIEMDEAEIAQKKKKINAYEESLQVFLKL